MSIYEKAFDNIAPDVATGIDRELTVEGTLPEGLRGTLLRNGPGLMAMGPDALNFLDGHGLIASLTFAGGAPRLRARLVDTPVFREESAAGRIMRRRLFTNHPSRWKNLAAVNLRASNTCAHDALMFQGNILATNDPFISRLDPNTLATTGRETFGDVVKRGHNVSPMPRFDPATGNLLGYTVAPGGAKPDLLTFFEVAPGGAVVRTGPTVTLSSSPAVVHQHAFTEHYVVITEMPARLSAPSALWGKQTIWQSLRWPAGQGLDLIVARRDGTGDAVRVRVPMPVIFHLANAFEDGGNLVVDACAYEAPVPFSRVAAPALRTKAPATERADSSGPSLVRLVLDPKQGKLIEHQRIVDASMEAPDMDRRFLGKRHRYVYGPVGGDNAGAPVPGFYGWFHGVGRIDVDTRTLTSWKAGPDRLASPPAFAPRAGSAEEGDGWLLSWVIGASGVDVVVLDARAIDKGPVATLHTGIHLPPLSHASFWPA